MYNNRGFGGTVTHNSVQESNTTYVRSSFDVPPVERIRVSRTRFNGGGGGVGSISLTSSQMNGSSSSASPVSSRSRSQPPTCNSSDGLSTRIASVMFLNTESNQQMSVAGTDFSSIECTQHSTFQSPSENLGDRSSARSRFLMQRFGRPHRTEHNRVDLEFNSSLLGRYRTIGGTSNASRINNELAGSESQLPRLVRFAPLRIDGNSTNLNVGANVSGQPVSLTLTGGSTDLDEFPDLTVRPTTETPLVSIAQESSSEATHERPSQSIADLPKPDEYSEHTPDSNTTVDQTIDISTEPNQYSNQGSSNSSPDVQTVAEISERHVSLRFPLVCDTSADANYPAGVYSDNTNHHEPEADHDFYLNECVGVPYRSNDHIQRAFSGLNELRRIGRFCDVVLQVNGTKLPAHRNVLAASSPYFHAMFVGPMAESRSPCVSIQGLDESALSQLIDFIYTGEIYITEENVQALLPASNLLQLNYVRDACCEFLQSQLHPSNCLGIQRFADLHDCADLLACSRRYTEQHFGELLKQDDEFLALTSDQLYQLISSDRLAVSEDQVFEAVLRWITHDVAARQDEARRLCSRVRFALLPRDYLVRLSQSDAFLSANPWCKDYLIEALSYHLLPWDQKLRVSSERAKPRTPVGLPKMLVAIGGQAPKAIRSVEYYDFRNGLWRSVRTESNTTTWQSSHSAGDLSQMIVPSTSTGSSVSPPTTSTPTTDSNALPSRTLDLLSRRCRCGVAVVGGLVYVVGGFNGALRLRSVDIYDPVRDSWNSGPNMECRRETLGVTILDNNIYAVGGFDGNTGLTSVEMFDLWSTNWRFIAPMSCRRSSVGACTLDGKVYAVGGYDGSVRRCLSTVECYDPATNTWSPVADMTCRRSGLAVAELNGRLYAVGGHDGPSVRNTAEVYSPDTGTWQRIADLNARRRNAGIVAHDGCLYIVGGEDGEFNLSSVEQYDPVTNTWVTLPGQMQIGRSYAGVAVIERNF